MKGIKQVKSEHRVHRDAFRAVRRGGVLRVGFFGIRPDMELKILRAVQDIRAV